MHKTEWTKRNGQNGNVMDVSNIILNVEVEYASGSRLQERLLL